MPKIFSICADEAADSSNQKQLPLIVDSNSIREEFVDFVLCNTGTTGVAIAEKLLAAMEELASYPGLSVFFNVTR